MVLIAMWKSKKSVMHFQVNEVPVIPLIFCYVNTKQPEVRKKKTFTYKDVKDVYTIILMDTSPGIFAEFPNMYIHSIRNLTPVSI